jgi:hypothetical protein
MSAAERKELVRRYQETPRPAGVYRVSHQPSGRVLVGASPDVRAMFNRIEAQLSFGSLPNKQLQADWDADGKSAFEFEVLDLLDPPDDPNADIATDLATLLDLWRDKLGTDEALTY